MDFFDKAISKAKDAFDVAYRKTDEIVTAQKQKLDIASLKTKRAKDYEKLGAIYFKMISDSEIENADVRYLVEKIKEKNEKIKELREELEQSKGKDNE